MNISRAVAWLAANRRNRALSRQAPYQWLLTLFHELSFPNDDERWRRAVIRCFAFLSWEMKAHNFLLRRSFPHGPRLLAISQMRLSPPDLEQVLASPKPLVLREPTALRSALAEVGRLKPERSIECTAVPARAKGRLEGILLVFHLANAHLPARGSLQRLGAEVGRFARAHRTRRPSPRR